MIGQVGRDSVVVIIKEAIRVKVPGVMEFIAEVTRKSDGKPVVIPAHYHNAFAIGRVVVNRNFYGFDEQDLGRQVTVTVQIFEKTVAGGKKYTAIDFLKVNGTRPACEIKITQQAGGESPVPIQGTSSFICFKPL